MNEHERFMSKLSGHKEYILVKVQNPTIHNTHDEGRFTTYEVSLQTNSPSFALKQSVVERRYSDFTWLRRCLTRTTDVKPPPLPFGRIFKTFEPEFLMERQKVLTEFMRLVVRETQYLSNTALHLFLQTNLKRPQMDSILKDAKRRGSMDGVTRAVALYGAVRPPKPMRTSSSNIALPPDRGALSFGYSQSVPIFNPDPDQALLGRMVDRHQVPATPPSEQGCLSTSDGSDCGQFAVNSADAVADYVSEWVVVESVSSDDDVTDGTMPSPEEISSEKAYTEVTWNVDRSGSLLSSTPSPILASPVCARAILGRRLASPKLQRVSRSFENVGREQTDESSSSLPTNGAAKPRTYSDRSRNGTDGRRLEFTLGGLPVNLIDLRADDAASSSSTCATGVAEKVMDSEGDSGCPETVKSGRSSPVAFEPEEELTAKDKSALTESGSHATETDPDATCAKDDANGVTDSAPPTAVSVPKSDASEQSGQQSEATPTTVEADLFQEDVSGSDSGRGSITATDDVPSSSTLRHPELRAAVTNNLVRLSQDSGVGECDSVKADAAVPDTQDALNPARSVPHLDA